MLLVATGCTDTGYILQWCPSYPLVCRSIALLFGHFGKVWIRTWERITLWHWATPRCYRFIWSYPKLKDSLVYIHVHQQKQHSIYKKDVNRPLWGFCSIVCLWSIETDMALVPFGICLWHAASNPIESDWDIKCWMTQSWDVCGGEAGFLWMFVVVWPGTSWYPSSGSHLLQVT